ncbi:MAG: enoyl-CoA hydratase/isomerase family protein [Acidobacteria bacterium]|nr:enoyl-CoA hydratase/isomerase family protein [Acidobacteriota bacterium]
MKPSESAMTLVASDALSSGVVVVTLDRPRANAISPELIEDLREALRRAAGAPVVLASSQRIFSGGWDLPLLIGRDRPAMADFLALYTALVREVFTYEGPLIAAINGHAIAGGLILAAAADERFAAAGEGRLGLSEVALAVPIPAALFEIFRYLLGDRGAERLGAGGENLSFESAEAIGLVDAIVPADDLSDRAAERAAALGERPRAAYAEIKRRSRASALARFDAAAGADPFLDFWFGADARGKIAALVEKLTSKR